MALRCELGADLDGRGRSCRGYAGSRAGAGDRQGSARPEHADTAHLLMTLGDLDRALD